MRGILYGVFFSLVFWGLLLFIVKLAKADDFDCLLVSPGYTEIDKKIRIVGENFTSKISCNIRTKRLAYYLGGPWCKGDKVFFRGVRKQRHRIYTCHVKNFR